MNTAIIMLGSNVDEDNNLQSAKEKLSTNFEIVRESAVVISNPLGKHYKSKFHNKAIVLLSVETKDETISIFKDIELEMGRISDSKKNGIIPIDIDLIFWNGKLVHGDYERFEFVRNCINEIR
jgi:2-amino-4-hydroxy-6-hydroxymethyldihydropteridine diphosphokinase